MTSIPDLGQAHETCGEIKGLLYCTHEICNFHGLQKFTLWGVYF